jgi:hypothetical protein
MKQLVWAFFALVLHSAVAQAQGISLADAARRERDRRQDMEAERQRLLKEVLKYTNAGEGLGQLSKGFSESADQLFAQFPQQSRDGLRNGLKKAALETLSASRLLPVYERSLSMGMDITTLTAVSDWYKTPLGAKIFHIETAQNGPPDENFLKRPVPPGRASLIDELDRQTKNTERAVAAIKSLNHALLAGILESSWVPQQTRDAFLSGYEQSFVAAITPRIADLVRTSNLFDYRTLSDDELDEYIHFLATPAGRKFSRVTWEATEAAMRKGGADLGTEFGRILKEMASTPAH